MEPFGSDSVTCLKTLSASREPAEIKEAVRALALHMNDRGFARAHYRHALQVLMSARLPSADEEVLKLRDEVMLRGEPDHTLLLLLDSISSTRDEATLDQCVCALRSFLRAGGLDQLLWAKCGCGLAGGHAPQVQETLVSHVVALPSITCNRLQLRAPPELLPQHYYPLLADALLHALHNTCHALTAGQDCSLGFIAQILGKVCVQGHSSLVCVRVAPRLASLSRDDALWRRVSRTLLQKVPEGCLESVVLGFLRSLSGAAALSRLMGDLVLSNQKARFVLTHKLLLQQYQHPTRVLRSVVGYLALDPERRTLLKDVLRSVCVVWCNSSAVKHTCEEQQLYVSKVLLLCVSALHASETEELREELLQCMLGGVQCRLDSNVPRLRRMGMVVGECLSQRLDSSGSRLQFQYEPDEESRELRSMMESVEDDEEQEEEQDQVVSRSEVTRPQETEVPTSLPSPSQEVTSEANGKWDSELDSDDDLIPYDMSCDVEKSGSSPPRYVRECLEALLCDEAERVSLALREAESLLRTNVKAAGEVSVEFVEVLLHLEDKYSTPRFLTLRQDAMKALLVTHPRPVAQYLTTEFYSLNYSLRQRLDILEVLTLSAQELSEPISCEQAKAPPTSSASGLERSDDITHWRQMVEKRIQSKTRRIGKVRLHQTATPTSHACRVPPQGGAEPVKATPNRFAPVAGFFFFPLLSSYDRPQVTFDLLGGDHLVLGKLLHTLGLLMHMALHAPVAPQMARALMDFVWALRFHTDQVVRRGAMFATCAVFLVVPAENLLTELGEDLMETRAWLADVAEKDCDGDCRSLAVQSLVLLEKSFKAQLQISPA